MNQKRFRAFIGTCNNPDLEAKDFLECLFTESQCKYLCGQLERGENGTTHIQYYIYFTIQQTVAQLKKYCKRSHFEPIIKDNGAADYCMKAETRVEGPFEFGIRPKNKVSKAVEWDVVREQAKKADWDSIPSDIYIKYYGNLKKIGAENTETFSSDDVRGYWLWGAPGTGKTTFARSEYGDDVYIKAQSKWWDGYMGQKIVILDDLDSDCLSHYLKIWADKWSCTGEIKGGTV